MKKKLTVGIIIVVVAAIGLVCLKFFMFSGRSPSRFLGQGFRQTLAVENMQEFIDVDFLPVDGSTIKDVTFKAKDGYVYTKEFKDVSPLEGVIRWVPADESSSMIQSRAISRWTGAVVDLRLPEDCAFVKGVKICAVSKNERVKNLVYISKDGKVLSKEYREGLLDRNFGGWLEIKATN
jgi:hypothetical protein